MSLPSPLCSSLAVEALADGLSLLAEVRHVDMPDWVARLDLGPHPVLWLDVDACTEDLCWAMLDALRALTFGPEHATDARPVRRLRPVS